MTEPVETYRSTVFPWHCDQFGHMNARWYAAHFDDASFHLYQRSGLSYGHMRKAGSIITVVAEIRIEYRHEMVAGDLLVIRSGFETGQQEPAAHRLALQCGGRHVVCDRACPRCLLR